MRHPRRALSAFCVAAVTATATGTACAGAWSDPRPAPGTPVPAQPTGTAAQPVAPGTPAPVVTENDLDADKADSVRAAFLLDSIARADSVRADSLQRAGRPGSSRR